MNSERGQVFKWDPDTDPPEGMEGVKAYFDTFTGVRMYLEPFSPDFEPAVFFCLIADESAGVQNLWLKAQPDNVMVPVTDAGDIADLEGALQHYRDGQKDKLN